MDDEYKLLSQKAKINWLKDGDKNTAFFHKVVKGRKHKSRIESIESICDDNGVRYFGDDVPGQFLKHFQNFLRTERKVQPMDENDKVFFKKLNVVEAFNMIKEITNEEIKKALFDIDNDKAPGLMFIPLLFSKRLEMLLNMGETVMPNTQVSGQLLTRRSQRNNRKKSLAPECKDMLMQKMKEVEFFNASKETREHGEDSRTQKEKRARCYKCKIRGHVYWKCPNKDKEVKKGKQKETVKIKYPEKVMYPEKVHVATDYMIEGTDYGNWDNTWFVGSAYKVHMCPTRTLFRRLKYKFVMIAKEESEKKFIFSYGIGDVIMETKEGNYGYVVKFGDNKCSIHYMFGGKGKWKAQEEIHTEVNELKKVITEHNKYLQKYFDSIQPKEEEPSLVKGLEELKWNKEDEQDYVDDEYISWNGSLYALKVNSLSRFVSFMDLLKKDSLVYKNWEIFSTKFVDMLKWFYLVHLNYERLDMIPPRVGVMEINFLSLHKIIGNLGGYLCVTLGDKWKTVASLQGLTDEDGEAMRDCYKRFIDLVQVYCETAERPWYDCRMPEKEMGESSRIGAKEDPQGMDKGKAGILETQGALEEGMNQETQFGVKLESNMEEDAEEESMTGSNDFEIIV
ncbi:ARID DNA-binding domain-containing protein [Tanacetum coccineum]|uniref:ARID DNA-binding domain-containing protein n=1 Tax=Tanacetum coccineum TaxID=301880 RepID=A0ABQ5A243_9ASTR